MNQAIVQPDPAILVKPRERVLEPILMVLPEVPGSSGPMFAFPCLVSGAAHDDVAGTTRPRIRPPARSIRIL
jgi:hypothetical protein